MQVVVAEHRCVRVATILSCPLREFIAPSPDRERGISQLTRIGRGIGPRRRVLPSANYSVAKGASAVRFN